MADEEVAVLLTTWNLSNLCETFQEHGIDMFCLQNMIEDDIKELIPVLRDRIIFRANLNKWKTMPMCTSICEPPATEKSPLDAINIIGNSQSLIIDIQERNGLLDILEKYNNGKVVLAKRGRNERLDGPSRSKLTSAIVEHYIKAFGCMRKEDFLFLAAEIADKFPGENSETYYIPSCPQGSIYIPARGKLIDKYNNQLRILRKEGVLQNRKRKLSAAVECVPEEELNREELSNTKLWLKYHEEPWVKVEEKWKETITYRFNFYYKSNLFTNVAQIVNEWPSLKLNLGHTLIELDFDSIYPNRDVSFYEKWPAYLEKSIALYYRVIKDPQSRKLLESSDGLQNDTITLILLCAALPSPSRIKIKGPENEKVSWKPSITESKDSFILHVQAINDVENKLKNRENQMRCMGLKCQPIIVAVGPTLQECSEFFVVYDNIKYKFNSILKSVDVCFKIFHVLHATYPAECVQVWEFIQKYFYNIQCNSDKKFVGVLSLLTELQ